MTNIFEEDWTPGSTLEKREKVFFEKRQALEWKERKGGILWEHRYPNGVRCWHVAWWE